jgi:hypothetical protein
MVVVRMIVVNVAHLPHNYAIPTGKGNVVVEAGSTITHGCFGFAKAASVLFSNRFA